MNSIAEIIDHTLLKSDATPAAIEQLCSEARKYHFCTVCINPCYVKLAQKLLEGTGTGVGTVIGFPLGANLTRAKAFEAEAAIEAGASELDMVANIGWLKASNAQMVLEDIKAVVKAAQGRLVKVIIEACLLTPAEKERATRLVKDAGAGFVKTSTGFSSGGATIEDIALLSKVANGAIGVKAAGGIRDLATARKMIAAGATRIGTSSGVRIAEEEKKKED
ncbi:deoxyribose-phosphate aldolase [candidate division WOR-3 bacterium JGI_Cruoil_03_51_56]|uniref:Deoxyribose-phosphate aldolase n=1 Tax=candidate division WOR-3 bacterium JGI_Cruoil_03_51_56 TaxID=1973747 RepID=A0A235BT91_UNCW3|nr:MAG: deoxyribose-phosphate aldolase [candidate division WOR-3 bacterium JGI_Cruoil_03_51_56]